jgi:hypothetical protein
VMWPGPMPLHRLHTSSGSSVIAEFYAKAGVCSRVRDILSWPPARETIELLLNIHLWNCRKISYGERLWPHARRSWLRS